MLRYIIQRMLLMVPTLLGVAVLCFFMLRLMPGDPVQMMMDGANVSKAVIEAERARLGLDRVRQIGREAANEGVDQQILEPRRRAARRRRRRRAGRRSRIR